MYDEHPILSPRHYAWLLLAFMAFVIYGSLVPLSFQAYSWSEGCSRFAAAFSKPVAIQQRSDWLANILLFIPLGFIAMGWRSVDRYEQSLTPVLMILPACSLFSTLIEFTQVWFPPRHTNVNDVVAETLGGAIGVGIWMAVGQAATEYLRQFWSRHAVHNWSIRLIPGYLVLLVFIHGMPFDLTLSPTCLKAKYNVHMILPVPFTVPGGEPLDLVKKGLINFAWFLPAGVLIAGLPPWFAYRIAGAWRVLGVGVLLAGTIEMMQLLVMSRYFDTTDIITGGLAVLAGWRLMMAWQERRDQTHEPHFPVAYRVALLSIWVLALVFIHWEPFSFRTDANYLSERTSQVSLIPFADYYAGNYLVSFNEMIQKTLLFVPFGLLLGVTGTSRSDTLIVLNVSFFLALTLEIGQLFMPHHHPGVSDLILETFGAWLGSLAANRLHALQTIPDVHPTYFPTR